MDAVIGQSSEASWIGGHDWRLEGGLVLATFYSAGWRCRF